MQEDREQKAPEGAPAEATSSETLKDVEETEKVSDEANDNSDSTGSPSPAPDGAFDEQGGRSPQDDPGPM